MKILNEFKMFLIKNIDIVKIIWYNKISGGDIMKDAKKQQISVSFSTYDAMKSTRGTWGQVDPRPRIVESGKRYKRHAKHKNRIEE